MNIPVKGARRETCLVILVYIFLKHGILLISLPIIPLSDGRGFLFVEIDISV